MTERDRAALDADPLRVQGERVAAGQHLPGERLVELDHLDVVEARRRRGRAPARTAGTMPRPGVRGDDPDRGRWPGSAAPAVPAALRSDSSTSTTAAAPSLIPHELPAVAVPRRRDEDRPHPGQPLPGHPGPRPLVARSARRRGTSSASNAPRRGRGHGPRVRAERRTRPAAPDRPRPRAATRSAASPISGSPARRDGAVVANGASPGPGRSVDADSTPPASTTPTAARPGRPRRPAPPARCRTAGPRSVPVRRPPSPACSAATRARSPPGPVQLPSTTSATRPARESGRRRAPARQHRGRPEASARPPCRSACAAPRRRRCRCHAVNADQPPRAAVVDRRPVRPRPVPVHLARRGHRAALGTGTSSRGRWLRRRALGGRPPAGRRRRPVRADGDRAPRRAAGAVDRPPPPRRARTAAAPPRRRPARRSRRRSSRRRRGRRRPAGRRRDTTAVADGHPRTPSRTSGAADRASRRPRAGRATASVTQSSPSRTSTSTPGKGRRSSACAPQADERQLRGAVVVVHRRARPPRPGRPAPATAGRRPPRLTSGPASGPSSAASAAGGAEHVAGVTGIVDQGSARRGRPGTTANGSCVAVTGPGTQARLARRGAQSRPPTGSCPPRRPRSAPPTAGRPEVPEVASADGVPACAWTPPPERRGGDHTPTGSRSARGRLRQQPGHGRVHAAGDQRRQHGLDQVAGEEDQRGRRGLQQAAGAARSPCRRCRTRTARRCRRRC